MIKKFQKFIKESQNFSIDPEDAYYEIIDTLDEYNIKYKVEEFTGGAYADEDVPAWVFTIKLRGVKYLLKIFYFEDILDDDQLIRNIFIDMYDPIEEDNISMSYKYDIIDFLKSKLKPHVNAAFLNMNINEGKDIYDKLDGTKLFPKSWPNDIYKADEIITKILDFFKVDYEPIWITGYEEKMKYKYTGKGVRNVLVKSYRLKNDKNIYLTFSLFLDQLRVNEFNGFLIKPISVFKFLKNNRLINYTLMNREAFLNMNKNESLSEEQIMNNKSTSFDEKEDQIIRLKISQINEYKSLKSKLESIFNDFDKDIDYITINKIIDDNPFLKQYMMLLSKKRELDLINLQIEKKEELIEQSKKELTGSNKEQREEILNQVRDYEQEINDLRNNRLEYDSVPNLLQKWDKQIIRTTRDLKQGKTDLISTLNNLR
jgi:hypothetical protein